MDKETLISLAREYVDASNAHDLARIRPMFVANARYQSSGVGDHEGAETILAMMQGFFETNPDVHWAPENFSVIENNGVEFDFVITLGGNSNRGVERLFFW